MNHVVVAAHTLALIPLLDALSRRSESSLKGINAIHTALINRSV